MLRLIRTILIVLVICSLVTAPTLAQNDPDSPTVDNLAHTFYIPLVAKTDPPPEWHPNFIRIDAASVSAAETQELQQICANPLAPASTAVSAQVLQQCLFSGIYSTVQSDDRLIFLGETPHIALGKGSSLYTFKEVNMVTGGGYTAGSNQLVPQEGNTIYWMDVSALPADQIRDVGVEAASIAVIDGGGALYMQALEKVLTTANELRKITISPDRPIYNLANAGSKTPRSCGMNGALVEVSLSYLGHRYSYPPAVRIETYDHVLASSIGKDRQVWPHEANCMLMYGDPYIGYRYITLEDLQKEPSYAAIDAKVKEELKKMNFYMPKFSWRGQAPTLPQDTKWAMTAQETGKNLVYMLIGYYIYKTGAFQPQHMYIIGTNACVEQFLQYGICKVTPKNE